MSKKWEAVQSGNRRGSFNVLSYTTSEHGGSYAVSCGYCYFSDSSSTARTAAWPASSV